MAFWLKMSVELDSDSHLRQYNVVATLLVISGAADLALKLRKQYFLASYNSLITKKYTWNSTEFSIYTLTYTMVYVSTYVVYLTPQATTSNLMVLISKLGGTYYYAYYITYNLTKKCMRSYDQTKYNFIVKCPRLIWRNLNL